ncbi:hypothetical protein B5C34_05215 [Pacificimonas flava]|uniref:Uncharacterized protein n=2 Tax=Pacificimonas TaxID=1960290 RepID=A0A219B3R5_9SPHN|nr:MULTISPECIES: hypothetical protein [Pacificimonas]MBZ6377382.1 hypothetical protein [Pacificimonas aurantium]OWV32911.1 hypothetical protein B5C34_05215 [Pacificimonas flava]
MPKAVEDPKPAKVEAPVSERSPNEVEPSPRPSWFDGRKHIRQTDGQIFEQETGLYLDEDGAPRSPAAKNHRELHAEQLDRFDKAEAAALADAETAGRKAKG